MSTEDDAPTLHVDSDWKAQARAEKDRLAEAERKAEAERGPGGDDPDAMPEASFRTLVSMLASQALMGLGTMVDPRTKGVIVDLEGSRFAIDLLAVLEGKTAGNLTEEEATELRQLLGELRNQFVRVTQAVMASGATPGAGPVGGPGATPGGASPIITE